MNLEDKFRKFILESEHGKCLDNDEDTFKGKRADYLVLDDYFIFEVKTLLEDRALIINEKLNDLADSDPNFPQFFGTVHIEEIIKKHKTPDSFRQWIVNYAARNIDSLIRKSNKQIAETQKSLGLENSVGVLVLLNQGIQLYDNDFIYQEVSRILHKRKNNRYERQYVEIVWLINETNSKNKDVTSLFIIGPSNRNPEVDSFLKMFQMSWASFNNYVILMSDLDL